MKSLFLGATEKFFSSSRQSLKQDPTSSSELYQIWDVTFGIANQNCIIWTNQWTLVYSVDYAEELRFAVFVQIHIPSACWLAWPSLIWASFWWKRNLGIETWGEEKGEGGAANILLRLPPIWTVVKPGWWGVPRSTPDSELRLIPHQVFRKH